MAYHEVCAKGCKDILEICPLTGSSKLTPEQMEQNERMMKEAAERCREHDLDKAIERFQTLQ